MIETSKNPAQQSEVDSNTAATVIDTSDFFLFNLLLMNQYIKQGGTKDKRKLRKVNRQKSQESQQESSILFALQFKNQQEQVEQGIEILLLLKVNLFLNFMITVLFLLVS